MCREDIRIGRNIKVSVKVVSAAVAPGTQLCGQSNNRVFLAFGISSVAAIIAPDVAEVGSGQGINFPAASPYQEFTIDRHGDLVTFPWRGSASAGNAPIIVMEGFYDDGEFP